MDPNNPSFKETNPKDKLGIAKVPLSTLAMPVIAEMGVGMFEGARKYGRHNWRKTGVLGMVYVDAAWRHLMDWTEGEDIDPVSGLSHITKAMTSLMVLRDAMIQGRGCFIDDRPPKSPEGWMSDLNEKAKEIIEKYPDPVEPITQLMFGLESKKDLSEEDKARVMKLVEENKGPTEFKVLEGPLHQK